MSDASEGKAPAGWYPAPEGSTALRYWDGDAWTDQVNQTTAATAAAVTDPHVLRAPAGIATTTVEGWLLAATPLLSIILLFPLAGFFSLVGDINPSNAAAVNALPSNPALLTATILGVAANVLFVVFAYLDERRLRLAGLPKPFPWGWAFLAWVLSGAGFVYVIGRTVVIRRRTGSGGLGPLWLFIALEVLLFVASLVVSIVFFVTVAVQFGTLLGQAGNVL